MSILKKILSLANKLASSLLKDKKIHTYEIKSLFNDEKYSDEIIERLSDPKLRTDYGREFHDLNKGKHEDWDKLKAKAGLDEHFIYIRKFGRVAAILLVCLGLAYAFNINSTSQKNIQEVVVNKNDIILKLDNGDIEVITESGIRKIINNKGEVVVNQNGTELNYLNNDKTNTKTKEVLTYNELTIPYGKRFQLVLSDGTVVHLNAGSSLKYPIKFIEGLNRDVFLKGEAYFDVAKDTNHPFIVNANDLNIRVLGTKFNVSSYSEDYFVKTVLVEGSVSLYDEETNYSNGKSILLTPGNKACWAKSKKKISIEKVNTSLYTDWINGKIVFEHMEFKNILKKLERHYNVSIINMNEKLSEQTFTATFDIETIEQVLNAFSKNHPFKYSIENNKIIIN